MIAPYTVLDCRSHTLYEPYTFDTKDEALKWFNSVAQSTIERDQKRILILYEYATMIKIFAIS